MLHKKALIDEISGVSLKKKSVKLAKFYNSPEGVDYLKAKGFSDSQIEIMQKVADETAQEEVL